MLRLATLPQYLFALCITLLTLNAFGQSKSQAFYKEAMDQIADGHYDSALSNLNRSIVRERNPDAFFLRGTLYEVMGEEMRALDDYSSTLKLNPNFKEAYFKRGELFYKNGVFEKAIKDFTFIIEEISSDDTQAIFFRIDPNGLDQVQVSSMYNMMGSVVELRGLTYQAIAEYDRALKDLDLAVTLDSSAQNMVNRALLYEEIGERDRALQNLEWAVELSPENEIAWFNLIVLAEDVEFPEHLIESDGFGPMLTYKAVDAYSDGDYENAEKLFKKALELNPEDPTLLLNAGRLNMKQGNYKKARKQFSKVLQLDERRLEAYYLIGNTFFKEQLFSEAAAYYEQFLVRDRSNGQIWYNAAMTYFEMNDLNRACDCIEQAMARGMESATTYLVQNCNQ